MNRGYEISKGEAHRGRRSRLQGRVAVWDVDGVLLFNMSNIRYLTGFTGSEGVLYIEGGGAVLLVDGRYTTQARRECDLDAIVEISDRMEAVTELLGERKVRRMGFEAAALSYEGYASLAERLPGVVMKPLSDDLNTLRICKDDGEIRCLRGAVEMSSQALAFLLEKLQPDMVERDIAYSLEAAMRERGAEKPSFETIVASGPNSAMPHAKPGYRKLQRGDFVVIDYGAICEGYHSDETCTIVVGAASDEQHAAYMAVKEAHDRAIDAIRSGVPCTEVDRVARACMEEKGLGAYFSHGTGHGVGLDVHEAPRLSKTGSGRLEAGMVVTVEPGMYIPGRWGVRIEDMVLVGDHGGVVLTQTPKTLTVV